MRRDTSVTDGSEGDSRIMLKVNKYHKAESEQFTKMYMSKAKRIGTCDRAYSRSH